MNLVISLLQLLPRQTVVYTRFLDLLHVERAALAHTQPAALESCTAERMQLMTELEAHDLELRTLFGSAKITFSSHAMKQFIATVAEPQRSQLARSWHQLLSIAAECKQHNAINSKIVDTRRQHTDRVLRILMGQITPTATIYASDGRVQPTAASATLATA